MALVTPGRRPHAEACATRTLKTKTLQLFLEFWSVSPAGVMRSRLGAAVRFCRGPQGNHNFAEPTEQGLEFSFSAHFAFLGPILAKVNTYRGIYMG